MDKDEMLRRLDLEGDLFDAPDPAPIVEFEPPPGVRAADLKSTPHALRLDAWDKSRGVDLVASSPEFAALGLSPEAAADAFAAAFKVAPELTPSCEDWRRRLFFEELFENAEHRALRETTCLRFEAAEVAARAIAERYVEYRDKVDKEEDEDAARLEAMMAAGEAARLADSEVGEAEDAAVALGRSPYPGRGAKGGVHSPDAVASVYRRVRYNRTLREICNQAGRFIRIARSRQRQKFEHPAAEVVDVTLGGDVTKLTAGELVNLAVPELKAYFLARLATRQCLVRKTASPEPVGLGPLIVTVDESGSMQGDPVHTAKGLALALAFNAKNQNRWCGLVAYSGDTGQRLLTLTPAGRWDEDALIGWLSAFLGGGSDLDVPIRELPDMYKALGAPKGKTDVIMITDAVCRISDYTVARFNAWKKAENVRAVALVTNTAPGDLAVVCEEVHCVPLLSCDSDAVGRALSI